MMVEHRKSETILLTRVSNKDSHYGGNLVDGSYVLRLFGDALTYLAAKEFQDEGLLKSYESVNFLAPVFPGDFLDIRARNVGSTRLSRTYSLKAVVLMRSEGEEGRPSATTKLLREPLTLCTALAKIVVPIQAIHEREAKR